jgi:transcriptional regulator GlxA family with amidase domain
MDAGIQKVFEVMRDNSHRRLTPADLAEHVQLSPGHFRHLFRAETGTTPARFLKSLRMQRAKELLENSFLATREIIRRVGFSNESHFARDFKRYYGVTPGQLRLAAHLARRNVEKREGEFIADVDGRADSKEPPGETPDHGSDGIPLNHRMPD